MAGQYKAMLLAFLEGWRRFDLDGVLSFMSEDAVFEPDLKGSRYAGKDAIRAIWGEYMGMMRSYDYELLSLMEGDGIATLERIEIVGSGRGGELRLPIVGVFHINAEGKISLWRDYWDTSMAPAH